jgi:acyl-CoA thioester hydrolase
VSCAFDWGEGRTGTVAQQLHQVSDGELVAEVDSVGGVLDLARRRLVDSPARFWRRHCARPELLGLPPG